MTRTGAPEFIGKVAVVEQAGRSVRVLLHEGETLYSARDILIACGNKYPEKWCKREQDARSSVKLMKLPYPVNGRTGGTSRRYCPMYFTSEVCGRMMLDMIGCDKSVRDWLVNEVFAFKIDQKEQPPLLVEVKETPPAPDLTQGRKDYLEKKIDEMLFALLDLKRYIAHQQA